MLLAFAADHSILFVKVPDILNLIPTLANDWAALIKMRLARTTAASKPRYSVGTTILDEIFEKVRHHPFH